MGRKKRNGFAWSKREDSLTATTPIGRYRVARGGGHATGVGAYFQRGKEDEQALGRFSTAERARQCCEQHFAEMRHTPKRAAA
jgi:hypothetical protein